MAIVNLGLFFGYPHTNLYTVPVLIIAKLYSNTLLVIFNSRMRIIGGREESALATRPESGLPLELGSGLQDHGPIFARPPSAYLNDFKIMGNTKDNRRQRNGSVDQVCHSSQFFIVGVDKMTCPNRYQCQRMAFPCQEQCRDQVITVLDLSHWPARSLPRVE